MFPSPLTAKMHELSKALKSKGLKVATAESCTGGLISALFTEIPGSSEVFERGYITYSNDSKIELLTVPTFYIEQYGAVSREVATAMAEGALLMSKADISIAVTGVAGPDGGTEDKPIGTVHIASAMKDKDTIDERRIFDGNRHSVRTQTTEAAIDMLLSRVS